MTQLSGAPGVGLQVPPLVSAQSIGASAPFVLSANPTTINKISLVASSVLTLPAGTWIVTPTVTAWIQEKDPIMNAWVIAAQTPNVPTTVRSDGSNRRVANISGCAVGAFITTVGSGYTNSTVGSNGQLDTSNSPTVTVSAGSSTWRVIVGGAVSGTVTITTAGAGYTHAPTLIVSAPPVGGVPATMTCTVSGGAINAVTVVNQGGGYQAAPTITVVPDPRDTVTTTAVLTAATTGSGAVTAMVCTDHGTAVTSVPTFTFSSGSAAATMVMAFTCTGLTNSTAGTGGGNAQPYLVEVAGGIVAGTAGTVVNPQLGPKVFTPRAGLLTGTTSAGGATQDSSAVIDDPGLFQRVPSSFYTASGTGLWTVTPVSTVTVGGTTDTVFIQASP